MSQVNPAIVTAKFAYMRACLRSQYTQVFQLKLMF